MIIFAGAVCFNHLCCSISRSV